MQVIGHKYICVQFKPMRRDPFGQPLQEQNIVVGCSKDELPVVPALHHMLRDTWDSESRLSWHSGQSRCATWAPLRHHMQVRTRESPRRFDLKWDGR